MRQKEIIFTGAISDLKIILKSYSCKNIFLIRGKNSYNVCGAKEEITKIAKNYMIKEYYDFSNNPKFEDAEFGYEKFKKSNSELLIAIGGGSVIDMAKLIKHFQILTDNTVDLPLIAIPTTAGTGSEATCFAVVYKNGIKNSIENEKLLPDYAIVDANLLQGQSKYQMAVSGLDAFAQGIESYWSINSTIESMKYSQKAIKLIWENLENAINGSKEAQIRIAEGSNFAGKAINIAKTTAAHALSYGFTKKIGLAHGHAVSISLPFFINLHLNVTSDICNDSRGATHISSVISEIKTILNITGDDLVEKVSNFYQKVGITINFKDLCITDAVYSQVIKQVNYERLNNNPVSVDSNTLQSLFEFKENNK